jgi:hypothetical protein
MANHRRSDWCEFAPCSICGTLLPRSGRHKERPPKKTCGQSCLYESRRMNVTTHGQSKSGVWYVWQAMRARCGSESSKDWSLYGGRGIRVCERWGSFEAFSSDMGPRPDGYMLERIDNDGDYCPENCKWATPQEQARNQRKTLFIEHDGRRLPLIEWSEITGINYRTLKNRMQKGWGAARALTEPARLGKNQFRGGE